MLCISAVSFVTSPFSFLILLIWVLSLFFLMSLANGLSILFIFLRNQLLVLSIFAIVFFVSISVISALIFMISFLLLTLGFVCSSFSTSFRYILLELFDFYLTNVFPDQSPWLNSTLFWPILTFFWKYYKIFSKLGWLT